MEHISKYQWEHAPAAAERVMQGLYDGAESLAQMPSEAGPTVPECADCRS